jgi:hypothetical protein
MIAEPFIRDLLNELGSSNITLPDIERRLVARLRSSASREGDARSVEGVLASHLEDTLRYAVAYDEKARSASPEAALYQRQAEGFQNTAQRTKALLTSRRRATPRLLGRARCFRLPDACGLIQGSSGRAYGSKTTTDERSPSRMPNPAQPAPRISAAR